MRDPGKGSSRDAKDTPGTSQRQQLVQHMELGHPKEHSQTVMYAVIPKEHWTIIPRKKARDAHVMPLVVSLGTTMGF